MTTTQFDLQRMGILARMAKLKPLMDQFRAMQAAAEEYGDQQKALAELDAREAGHKAELHEARVAAITSMSIAVDSAALRSDLLGTAVPVVIVRNKAEVARKPLSNLDAHEEEALIRGYWQQVPASIRALAETPVDALEVYGAAKRRGYFRG